MLHNYALVVKKLKNLQSIIMKKMQWYQQQVNSQPLVLQKQKIRRKSLKRLTSCFQQNVSKYGRK